MMTDELDFVVGSIEDLNATADAVAREILAVRDREANDLRDALLDALHEVEHTIRTRTTTLMDILSTRCPHRAVEPASSLRRHDIADFGVLYR